jgi:aerobic-type carbon monoxide dehydrogenase small subunit (CoxS/CutS family)
MPTSLVVNGVDRTVDAPATETLLAVLRDDLHLTGTKYGCGEGQCGACTVLLDGRPVRSCSVRLAAAAGKRVTTIEGLEKDGRLHPVQEAFIKHEAMQCGYCTSGMIVAAAGFLQSNAAPDAAAIVRALDRNVCRCGTYSRIVAAVADAASVMRGRR